MMSSIVMGEGNCQLQMREPEKRRRTHSACESDAKVYPSVSRIDRSRVSDLYMNFIFLLPLLAFPSSLSQVRFPMKRNP